jgi:N6-L-threonylcarbamoyladenine synthase
MNPLRFVLAIETSCDDTSVAVLDRDGFVIAQTSASQDDKHKFFGGIVPEIASRNHTLTVIPLIEKVFADAKKTWKDIDGIAVTNRPGLVGSLLVGLMTAKTLALVNGIPFIGINHLEGHLLAGFLKDEKFAAKDFSFPFLGLVVSGGHTTLYEAKGIGNYKVLGQTVDDAAGEAFDKFAVKVGLGFPGGAKVDNLAKTGKSDAFKFPRAMMDDENLNFSFSGLKTAAVNTIAQLKNLENHLSDICASYQEAIVDVLIHKLDLAQQKTGLSNVTISGGVSANSRLRSRAEEWGKQNDLNVVIPPLRYCTDNAAMIGYAGLQRLLRGESSPQTLGPSAAALPADFQ